MAALPNTPIPDSVEAEVFIAAPPQTVFQALVEPQQVLAWWGQAGIYRCTEFAGDLRVGGRWRTAGVSREKDPFVVQGEYLVIESPHVLVYSWVASWTGEGEDHCSLGTRTGESGDTGSIAAHGVGGLSADRAGLPGLATHVGLAAGIHREGGNGRDAHAGFGVGDNYIGTGALACPAGRSTAAFLSHLRASRFQKGETLEAAT
jgi:uncharacterized protein YndB with AHSA1/START domain